MNVIASLTRSQPKLAEETVEDLAELFRASITDVGESISLSEELDILERYIRIEKHRLGDRLRVSWHIETLPKDARVPALILQPLVENAIYHGIEPRAEGGEIRVSGSLAKDWLTIVLENPVAEAGRTTVRQGNRLAMDNIRQRLEVFYDPPGSMKVEQTDDNYRVTLRIPYQVELV
jgi:two-component system sensor histidine kinase AlgZ